jgi:hypothetical protein
MASVLPLNLPSKFIAIEPLLCIAEMIVFSQALSTVALTFLLNSRAFLFDPTIPV